MDYKNYTLVELRQLAKEKGTKNVSKLKKDELIQLLRELEETDTKEISNNYEKEETENVVENNNKHFYSRDNSTSTENICLWRIKWTRKS